jgi:hypothetical protein
MCISQVLVLSQDFFASNFPHKSVHYAYR